MENSKELDWDVLIDNYENLDVLDYFNRNNLNRLLDGEALMNGENKKWSTIEKDTTPSFPEISDLARLHYLASILKARKILEFGVGYSTVVFADALRISRSKYSEYVKNELRERNTWQLVSVEKPGPWGEIATNRLRDLSCFHSIHYAKVKMSEFNGRVCTRYESLPLFNPNLIYLDAPDTFSTEGLVYGITTDTTEFMPMSADILAIEHFLQPGTVIIIDGRTANARFILSNLQRPWTYRHLESCDQHIFVLNETPLGKWNSKALKFITS